ncbi:MAG TPA: phenylalanine--tRNA ligase subunit beta [Thermoprotei archaeon]|nr:phenylalanine--tRNA ligase subunit beta [Thermoprotei archaeon]
MPTTKIYYDTILKETGMEIDEFIEVIPYAGLEVDEIAEEYLKLEYTPNRIDYGFPYGIFKTLRGITDMERGILKYTLNPPKKGFQVVVDNSLKVIRPYISCFVVKNLTLSETDIEYIINFQEDLHKTIGRNRRKASIGIHDFTKVEPPIYYVTEKISFKFHPLGFEREISIKDILKMHPKGIEYGDLIPKKYGRFPILKDSQDMVLSMPPIINSIHTQVTPDTKDLFIDVTGWDENAINQILVLLLTSLADLGGEIYQVEVAYSDKIIKAPQLEYSQMVVSHDLIQGLLGMDITKNDVINSLERMRFEVYEKDGNYIVTIPPYRFDILHPVDIVEDIAIGIGFWKIKPEMKAMYYSEAKHLDIEDFIHDKIIPILTGMGFIEVINMMLINKEVQTEFIKLSNKTVIEVVNPKTSRNTIRHMLLPGLLENVFRNINEEYPLKLFEIGWVIEEDLNEKLKLCVVIASYRVNYGDIKAVVDALLSNLGIKDIYKYEKAKYPFLINGRSAKLTINSKEVGFLGEVNPEILLKFNINIPTVVAELYIKPLFKVYQELD